MDDDHSFFEKERDRLSREITAVRYDVARSDGISLIAPGLWGTAFLDECAKSKTGRSAWYDKRVRHHCGPVEQLLPAHERADWPGNGRWGGDPGPTRHRHPHHSGKTGYEQDCVKRLLWCQLFSEGKWYCHLLLHNKVADIYFLYTIRSLNETM